MLQKLFFSDRKFCQGQKLFSLTEVCFSDGNLDRNLFLFSKGNLFSVWFFFCGINFFLWRKLVSVTESFLLHYLVSVTKTCTLFSYVISRVKFREKWEFPLSRITKKTTWWRPTPPPSPLGHDIISEQQLRKSRKMYELIPNISGSNQN